MRPTWLPEPLAVPLHFTCICCAICLYVFLSAGGCLRLWFLSDVLSSLSLSTWRENFSEQEWLKSRALHCVSSWVGWEQLIPNLSAPSVAEHKGIVVRRRSSLPISAWKETHFTEFYREFPQCFHTNPGRVLENRPRQISHTYFLMPFIITLSFDTICSITDKV